MIGAATSKLVFGSDRTDPTRQPMTGDRRTEAEHPVVECTEGARNTAQPTEQTRRLRGSASLVDSRREPSTALPVEELERAERADERRPDDEGLGRDEHLDDDDDREGRGAEHGRPLEERSEEQRANGTRSIREWIAAMCPVIITSWLPRRIEPVRPEQVRHK